MPRSLSWFFCGLQRLCVVAAAWALASMLLVQTREAHADKPKDRVRIMSVERRDSALSISFDASEFANQNLLNKIQSGLPQNIVVRVAAYDQKSNRPWAIGAQSCRIVYDLWEGSYHVRLERPNGARDITVRDASKVVDACLKLRHLQLSDDASTQRIGTVAFCKVDVEFNPMSPATIQRIRRWLSRSSPGQLKGDAFFGSFVSIFVGQELGAADRAVSFRSQMWVVPP